MNRIDTGSLQSRLSTQNPNTLNFLNTAFPLGSGDPNYMVHALQDLQDRERSEPLAESRSVVATPLHHSMNHNDTDLPPSILSTQDSNTPNCVDTAFPLGSGDPSYIVHDLQDCERSEPLAESRRRTGGLAPGKEVLF